MTHPVHSPERKDLQDDSNGQVPYLDTMPTVQAEEFLPPISAWTHVGGIFLVTAVAVAVCISSVVKIPLTATVVGLFRSEREPASVSTELGGQVSAVDVRIGETVTEGQILGQVDNSHIEIEIRNIRDQISLEESRLQATRSAMPEELSNLRLSMSRAEDRLAKLKKQKEDFVKENRRVSKSDLYKHQIEQFNEQIRAAQDDVTSGYNSFEQAKAQQDSLVEQAQANIESLRSKSKRLEEQKKEKSMLAATISGKITYVVQSSALLRQGEPFAVIQPTEDLIIEAAIARENITQVRESSDAFIRVSGCTYTDYGVLEGKVYAVLDRSGAQPAVAGGTANSEGASSVKVARIDFDQDSFKRSGCDLTAGMTGRVDVVYDTKSILRVLLEKVRLAVDV